MPLLVVDQPKSGGRQALQQIPQIIFRSHAGSSPHQDPARHPAFFVWVCPFLLEFLPFLQKGGRRRPCWIRRFSSFGPAMAARMKGMPVLIHEANRAVGKAVRFLAKRSSRLYLPEGMQLEGISPEITRNIGYPLRQEFRRIPRERARRQLGVPQGDRLLVVLGGSQGAASLNAWVKKNIEELAKEGISTYCLTGMNKESSGVVELEGPIGQTVTSRFVPFTDEMNAVLSAADLVISRAGAGAIAEIIRCRVPSVLVPYPHAADNHQYLNASFLERKGGGIVCLEEKMKDILLDEVREVMFNEEFRAILRRNLFSMDGGDVAGLLATDLIQLLKDRSQGDSVPGGVLRMVG